MCFVSSVRNLSQDTADEFSSISTLNPTTISYYPVQEWKYSENPSKFLFSIEYTLQYSNISALNVHHEDTQYFCCKASSLQNAERRWRIHESSFSKIHFYLGYPPLVVSFLLGTPPRIAKDTKRGGTATTGIAGVQGGAQHVGFFRSCVGGLSPAPHAMLLLMEETQRTTCDVKKSCILMGSNYLFLNRLAGFLQ